MHVNNVAVQGDVHYGTTYVMPPVEDDEDEEEERPVRRRRRREAPARSPLASFLMVLSTIAMGLSIFVMLGVVTFFIGVIVMAMNQ